MGSECVLLKSSKTMGSFPQLGNLGKISGQRDEEFVEFELILQKFWLFRVASRCMGWLENSRSKFTVKLLAESSRFLFIRLSHGCTARKMGLLVIDGFHQGHQGLKRYGFFSHDSNVKG